MPEENPRRKSTIIPTIVVIIVIALIAAGGYWAWSQFMSVPAAEPEEQPIVETPPVPQTMQYASSTMKFSLTYPAEFQLQENYAYTAFEGKPISGVRFAVPASFTQGTNLSADTGISVEQLPRANLCTGDIYLLANVRAQTLTDGAVTYSVASSTEGAAGNVYEEMVYAFPDSSPCIAVRYFIHSNQIGNFATGTREFDRAGLFAAFDEIRRSIVVQQ